MKEGDVPLYYDVVLDHEPAKVDTYNTDFGSYADELKQIRYIRLDYHERCIYELIQQRNQLLDRLGKVQQAIRG